MRSEDAAEIMKSASDVMRTLAGGLADADLDRLVGDLQRLPANPSGRGQLAAALVVRLAGEPIGAAHRLRHIDVLLALADQDPPTTPEWPRQRAVARALAIGHAVRNRTVADYKAWLAELDGLTEAYGDDVAMRGMFTSTRAGVVMLQAMATGDEAVVRRLPTEMQAVRDLGHLHPLLAEMSAFVDVSISGMRANQAGDIAGAFATLEQLRAMTDQLPAGHMMRGVMDETAAMLAPFRRMLAAEATGSTYALSDEELAAMVELAQRVDAPASDRALNHATAGGALLAMGQESDPERIDMAIGHLRQALELAGADNQNRAFYLQSLALGLFRRAEVRGGTAGLDEALTVLEEAELLIGGPQHPQWTLLRGLRAGVLRRLGENRAGRRAAMEGLRGYAWRALVQADTAAAKIAIRGAVRDATDLARECLTDNSVEDALQALDAGRGLLLFAASSLRDVAAQLDAAGRPELAWRWREAGTPGTPEEKLTQLRREVVAALSADETAMARLLDPPSLTEIRSALRALDADALVYLVPGAPGGEQTMPGVAVIAPVDGPASYMVLPDLVMDEDVDVERYLTALARRDLTPPQAQEDFAGRLDAVCDWAWRAAMGPLVDQYLGTRPTSGPARTPRVVLVPMGDLARIPWPAARRWDGTYAVQLAAFSLTTSARMLCEAASRAPVPLAPVGLVVADPDTAGRAQPLLAARREAHAVHQAFYRGGRYVGRRPDGSTSRSGGGTPDDVRAWLTSSSPAAGAMLHLACHGEVVLDAKAPRSMLLLAGNGGGELSAEELVGVMAGARQRAVGLVVLAACHTGTSIHGYDEAYSLGTAFLAGGARSVLSTQWAIPDVTTSSLMFMFHYYLRRHRLPAWRALRQAQLWMLDPHRKAPPEMPAELRPQASAADNAQVVAWAGFVHWGR